MMTMKWSVLFVGAALLAQSPKAAASCGTFEVSKGDVKVQSADGKTAPAPVGAKICSGQTVIAADQARAKIHMEDGNELNISPNSKIVIEAYQYDVASNKKKVLLNVLKGKVRATTAHENMYNDKAKDGQANTFQVRTKSAVAGVRGTDFLTGFDPKTSKTDIVTFRGKVEVGQPGPSGAILNLVQVAVGQKTEVMGGQAPSTPRAVPTAEMTKMNVETRNEAPAAESKTSGASETKGDRQPASADAGGNSANSSRAAPPGSGGCIMMCGTPGGDPPKQEPLPPMPPMMAPPPIPQLPAAVTANPFVNQAIQNKNANANVKINLRIGN